MRDGRTDAAIGEPSVELVEMTHLWPEKLVSPRCVESEVHQRDWDVQTGKGVVSQNIK